jgi:hypothetical protein
MLNRDPATSITQVHRTQLLTIAGCSATAPREPEIVSDAVPLTLRLETTIERHFGTTPRAPSSRNGTALAESGKLEVRSEEETGIRRQHPGRSVDVQSKETEGTGR